MRHQGNWGRKEVEIGGNGRKCRTNFIWSDGESMGRDGTGRTTYGDGPSHWGLGYSMTRKSRPRKPTWLAAAADWGGGWGAALGPLPRPKRPLGAAACCCCCCI